MKAKRRHVLVEGRRFARLLKDRFWERVTPTDPDRCWLWCGQRIGGGYGTLYLGPSAIPYGFTETKRRAYAHRISWVLHNGSIPDGMRVLHHCDVPACVNPAHLFLGTDADNIADKVAKGRAARNSLPGEANPNSRLSVAQVAEIRALYVRGSSEAGVNALAKRYGCSKSNISNIIRGSSWRAA